MTRAPTSKAPTRLRTLINGTTPLAGDLPLVHITDAYRFADMSGLGELIPTQCKVFGEPLIYMFYGRPAYRTKRSGTLPLDYDLPIALIFRQDYVIKAIRRIYPFDTGAFAARLYEKYFHPDSEITDFELDTDFDAIKRFLGLFYQSMEQYLTGRSLLNVDLPPLSFEAQGLHELARAPANPVHKDGQLDERASSVELQTTRSIKLKGSLLGIVIPNLLLQDNSIADFIRKIDVNYLEVYESIFATDSSAFATLIYDKVISIYRKEKII